MSRERPRAIQASTVMQAVAGLNASRLIMVPVERVHIRETFNPRGRHTTDEEAFNEADLRALGENMRDHGVIQPIVVTADEHDQFHLVAGERRLRAARLVGLTELPAMLSSSPDAYRTAVMENLHRQNLNVVDETFAVLQLLSEDTRLSLDQLPAALRNAERHPETDPHQLQEHLRGYGVTHFSSWARHRLQLLQLTPDERLAITTGTLPWRTVTELTRLGDDPRRPELLQEALDQHLTQREVRALVQRHLAPPAPRPSIRQLFKGVTPRTLDALEGEKRTRAEHLLSELQKLLQDA